MATRLYDEALLDLHSRRWRDADIRLRRVLDLNPTYPGAARRLRQLETWQRAESDFRRGLRAAEDKHWREAIAWFDHAIAAIGEYPDASVWKGICQSELRREQAQERSALALVLNRKVMASVTACALTLCSVLSASEVTLPLPASRVVIKTEPDTTPEVPELALETPSPLPAAELPGDGASVPAETSPDEDDPASPSHTPTIVQSSPSATRSTATVRPTGTPTRRPAPVIVLGPTATPTRPRATRTPTPARPPATATATRAGLPTETAVATPGGNNPTVAPTATPTPAGGVILVVTSSPTAAPTATSRPAATSTSSVVQLSVSAGDYYFSPAEIVVRAGSTVRITFKNNGNMTHHWRLLTPAGRVLFEISAAARSQATGLFVAPPRGQYTFDCPLGDHAERGMTGTLTVQ